MQTFDNLGRDLIESKNAEQELKTVESLHHYSHTHDILLSIYLVDLKKGKELPVSELASVKGREIIVIIKAQNGNEERSLKWQPLDQENIYILMRE